MDNLILKIKKIIDSEFVKGGFVDRFKLEMRIYHETKITHSVAGDLIDTLIERHYLAEPAKNMLCLVDNTYTEENKPK